MRQQPSIMNCGEWKITGSRSNKFVIGATQSFDCDRNGDSHDGFLAMIQEKTRQNLRCNSAMWRIQKLTIRRNYVHFMIETWIQDIHEGSRVSFHRTGFPEKWIPMLDEILKKERGGLTESPQLFVIGWFRQHFDHSNFQDNVDHWRFALSESKLGAEKRCKLSGC